MIPLALVGAAALALIHLFAGKLRFLSALPRSRWLSFASGISVAYVFMHLLPELREAQEVLAEEVSGVLAAVDSHIYLIALAGLTVFYGMERLAKSSRDKEADDTPSNTVFWIHIGSFSVYNALIGYILAERAAEPTNFWLFLFAIGLHFFVNDFGLRQHHKHVYHDRGRWVLAAAVLAGAGAGLLVRVSELALLIPIAFIGGGVILNVLKEELPEERQSNFGAFLAGTVAYAALLLMV